jgi:ERF superfamily
MDNQPENIPVGAGLPSVLLRQAVDKGASLETLERLMALYERSERLQARKEFDDAISRAKAEMPIIIKNRMAGFDSKRTGGARTEYAYEDLAEIMRVVDPILAKHGLSIRWRTSSEINAPIHVTCVLSHRAGYFEENGLHGPRDESGSKNPLQAIGSTLTYLQRYTVKAALGLAAARDDDAEITSSDAPATISAEQVIALIKRLDQAGLDQVRFCKGFDIADIHDLPAAEWDTANKRIETFVNARASLRAAARGEETDQ